jgi:hypothetical protein
VKDDESLQMVIPPFVPRQQKATPARLSQKLFSRYYFIQGYGGSSMRVRIDNFHRRINDEETEGHTIVNLGEV